MQREPKDAPQLPTDALSETQMASDSAGGPLLTPGNRVQQYEIIREIGAGGMGQVVLARDTKLGRLVALKFVNSWSEEINLRFLNEARTTAQLSHENIVVIHEVSEVGGRPFMALEYLEGEPLRRVCIPGSALPVSRVVELMVPVVRALVRAHQADIVHRDLKPENIVVTTSGQVKVLDFGLAKVFESDQQAEALAHAQEETTNVDAHGPNLDLTQEGALMGTLPYMSPEQWGYGTVDHRTDIWAVGIMLFEMLSGSHPLAPVTPTKLLYQAGSVDVAMPSLGAVRGVPEAIVAIVERCLQKQKSARFADAQALLDELEKLLPGRLGRKLDDGESPYPGLTAFQESDANRFFGRGREVQRAVRRIREKPLMGIVGPTGVGKSSFVRAGLVPALKTSGEDWQALIVRPGRDPLVSLANLLAPLSKSSRELEDSEAEHRELMRRIRAEPGYVGTLLRAVARRDRCHLLVFVDQFEELYTLVGDKSEREAFVAALVGIADDPSSPLRVVVSMRSDFLDRLGESEHFLDALSEALIFLQPPDREGLQEALTLPIHAMGYQFESPSLVSEMLDALATTPGALPLLQFAAASLWEHRDKGRRLLTEASYQRMGGVAGTLACHADEVLESLATGQLTLVRKVFQRLVTAEGTRAIVDMSELQELHEEPTQVDRLISYLVESRLLVVQSRGGGHEPTVEIVHESLITQWPALRFWLEENQEDGAFLEQLRSASKQWDQKGRPAGLLWHGEAEQEALHFRKRFKGQLAGREMNFLDEVVALGIRSVRRKRARLLGIIAILSLLLVAGAVALVVVRKAEQEAVAAAEDRRQQLERIAQAESETDIATRERVEAEAQRSAAERLAVEAEREAQKSLSKARLAESQVQSQIETVQQAETEQAKAETEQAKAIQERLKAEAHWTAAQRIKAAAEREVKAGQQKVELTNEQLAKALKKAQAAKLKAQAESKKAQEASAKLQQLLSKERKANQALKLESNKIKTGRLQ